MYSYDNKVAVITGASSGFGKALAHRLVSSGASVVLGDVDQKSGSSIVSELNRIRSNSAVFAKCDVTNKKDLANLFDLAVKHFGHFDIVANNAGIGDHSDFYSADNDDSWTKVLDIDLNAVIAGTRIAYKYFSDNSRSGVIINTASLAGLYPYQEQPVYAAAKAGVVNLSRSVGLNGAASNIYCVAMCPSFAPTGIVPEEMRTVLKLIKVEDVIDAFIMAIEDGKKFNAKAIRITPQKGTQVFSFGGSKI